MYPSNLDFENNPFLTLGVSGFMFLYFSDVTWFNANSKCHCLTVFSDTSDLGLQYFCRSLFRVQWAWMGLRDLSWQYICTCITGDEAKLAMNNVTDGKKKTCETISYYADVIKITNKCSVKYSSNKSVFLL